MRHRTRALPLLTGLVAALMAVGPVAVNAQDASGAPDAGSFCAILSADEVKAAFGIALAPAGDDTDCSYQTDPSTTDFLLFDINASDGTLNDMKLAFPDLKDTEIAGRPAIIADDGSILFVEVDGRILSLQAYGTPADGVDIKQAIQDLAATAVDRLPSIPLPSPEPQPSLEPLPSFAGDPELQAMMPTTVGDQPVEIFSMTGDELLSQNDDEQSTQQIEDSLAAMGRTIADLSVAFGYTADGAITAIRVKGADAAALEASLTPLVLSDLEDPVSSKVTLSGKEVTKVIDGPEGEDDTASYLYTNGEILWVVQALEPSLSQIFSTLP